MSVRVDCGNKEILHVKNIIIVSIHENIVEHIENTKLDIPENVKKLIEYLEIAALGWGFNITDYLKNKYELLVFADLLKKAIEKEQAGPYPYREDVEELLNNFYNEIVDYANKVGLSETQSDQK